MYIYIYIYSIDVYCVYHLKSSWNPRVNFWEFVNFVDATVKKKIWGEWTCASLPEPNVEQKTFANMLVDALTLPNDKEMLRPVEDWMGKSQLAGPIEIETGIMFVDLGKISEFNTCQVSGAWCKSDIIEACNLKNHVTYA